MKTPPVIRKLTVQDREPALEVINMVAEWYREFLPPDELHTPEMDGPGWEAEAQRMTWWGAFAGDDLVAVMGSEPIDEVVLLRHAYVLPRHQRQGIASQLLDHIQEYLPKPVRLVVGTYAANHKARGVLERSGFVLAENSKELLRSYFDIPDDRRRGSVAYEKKWED